MPDQLTLFDLPAAAPAAPGAPKPARAARDTAPAPRAAQAPRAAAPAGQTDPTIARARRAAEQAAALADVRAPHLERIAAWPAPSLPDADQRALVRVAVNYLGSYVAQEGDASGAGAALHVVEGEFRPASGRGVLVKTTEGIARLLEDLDLPDDLLAAGMRRAGHPAHIRAPDEGDVGVTFAFATLERNIEAAREFLAARARRLAAEAAPKPKKKARAS